MRFHLRLEPRPSISKQSNRSQTPDATSKMSMIERQIFQPRKRKIPRPPGASVELPHVSAEEPELVRHRAMLDAVSAPEFLLPFKAAPFASVSLFLRSHLKPIAPSPDPTDDFCPEGADQK